MAKYRPGTPIIAITTSDKIRRRLAIYWGVHPFKTDEYTTLGDIFRQGAKLAVELGIAKDDDLIVVTAGLPTGIPGNTNMIKFKKNASPE